MDELRRIWDDQADFNSYFRDPSTFTFEQRTAETKEIALHMMTEIAELVKVSGAWKPHRRQDVRENKRAVGYEIADIFKYVMTEAMIQGFTFEEFIQFYWEKSMIVRQRYSQEFVQSLDRSAVVVDIDNVLADYIRYFTMWMIDKGYVRDELGHAVIKDGLYVNAATLHMSPEQYDEAKHLFRVSGEHVKIPLMPGAHQFMDWLVRDRPDRSIIVLTSRPIDQYPNLYGETLQWLAHQGVPHHFVWWAGDKGEAIRHSGIANHVELAIDDEFQYVEQFARVGVTTYWLNRHRPDAIQQMKMEVASNIRKVGSLSEVKDLENENV